MAVQQSGSNSKEVGVTRVINLHHTPWILAGADLAAANLHNIFRTNNSEGHQSTKLGVLLHSILIILLNIVGEVVHGNAVVLNVLHYELLRFSEFGRCQGVRTTNHGDDIDAGSKALHQLDVQFTETKGSD